MVTKEMKEFPDSAGVSKRKGNMDMEMACHVFSMLPHIDQCIVYRGWRLLLSCRADANARQESFHPQHT